jgi:hypothetical protein
VKRGAANNARFPHPTVSTPTKESMRNKRNETAAGGKTYVVFGSGSDGHRFTDILDLEFAVRDVAVRSGDAFAVHEQTCSVGLCAAVVLQNGAAPALDTVQQINGNFAVLTERLAQRLHIDLLVQIAQKQNLRLLLHPHKHKTRQSAAEAQRAAFTVRLTFSERSTCPTMVSIASGLVDTALLAASVLLPAEEVVALVLGGAAAAPVGAGVLDADRVGWEAAEVDAGAVPPASADTTIALTILLVATSSAGAGLVLAGTVSGIETW